MIHFSRIRHAAALALVVAAATLPGEAPAGAVAEGVTLSTLGPAPARSRCSGIAAVRAVEKQVLAQVNGARRAQGLPPVRASGKLSRVAQAHACDMAAQGRYTHTGSDGSDLSVRLRRGGYKFRLGAENTARGFDSSDRVVGFWMQSVHHRENILQVSATEVGLGLAQPPGDRPYWVLVLAAPRR